jgi:hypothetical protein
VFKLYKEAALRGGFYFLNLAFLAGGSKQNAAVAKLFQYLQFLTEAELRQLLSRFLFTAQDACS